MSHSMMNFTKGIVTGVVVGTTVGMVVKGLSKPKRSPFRKNADKALKSFGAVVNNLSSMMG